MDHLGSTIMLKGMNKQWLVWLQVTTEEDTYKSKNTLTFNMFKLILCLFSHYFFKQSPSTFSVLDLLFCEWLIPKCTQKEVLCFQALLHQIPVVVFFYCFSFLLSELLLMLLPLCFMFFPFFHHKIPHLLKKNPTQQPVKEKKQSAYSFCVYSRLFTVHQKSRCPTEIAMADWSLLFTGLNLSQMESPLGFTPSKFSRIWLKRKLPGSVGKLHD